MLVIARSTQKELARQVSYLKVENQILRSRLPDRISLTQREKNRLVRFAKNLGSALNELATIVHPGTIRRWIRETVAKSSARRKKSGRPRTAEQIEKLILKLAKENGWGTAESSENFENSELSPSPKTRLRTFLNATATRPVLTVDPELGTSF